MRFSEVGQAVPELSDRLLSARMKELEARGIVERTVHPGPPVRVEYSLSRMGRELGPALSQLQVWAQRWLNDHRPPEPALPRRWLQSCRILHLCSQLSPGRQAQPSTQ